MEHTYENCHNLTCRRKNKEEIKNRMIKIIENHIRDYKCSVEQNPSFRKLKHDGYSTPVIDELEDLLEEVRRL